MQNENDKILEKVRKLLRLAESSNEHEAASAMEKAHALLARHNLDIAEVTERPHEAIVEQEAAEGGRVGGWYSILAQGVAYSCWATCFRRRTRNNTHTLVFLGTRANVTVAQEIFAWLVGVVNDLAEQNAGGQGRSFANGYRLGMAERLSERLCAKRTEVEASTALVLYDAEALERAEQQRGLMPVRQSFASHRGGQSAGYRDGDSIGLDTQIGRGNRNVFRFRRD